MTPALLLDCDTGIDDALTLLYLARLVRLGQVELAAVGTVHGNVAAGTGALNTLRVLECAGLDGIPVAVGAGRPMVGAASFAHDWHGRDGLGETGLPAPAGAPSELSAPEQIIRLRGLAGHAGPAGRDAPDRSGRRLAGPAGRGGQRHRPVRDPGPGLLLPPSGSP